jgi:hypothetical protein
MFINLKTDPCILHSSPHCACVNLPPPIAVGLPLTSALRRYSDSCSRPRSDTPRTPTHVRTRTLLRLLLTSTLGCYSDSCSLPCSDSTRNPALVVLSICLPAIPYLCIPTSLKAPCLSTLRVLGTPLGRLNSSYKSKPVPLDSVRTSVLVRITIRTLAIQLCSEVRSGIHSGIHSDICVLLHLTSSTLCLWGLLRPLSLSALHVPHRSELLVTGNIYHEQY